MVLLCSILSGLSAGKLKGQGLDSFDENSLAWWSAVGQLSDVWPRLVILSKRSNHLERKPSGSYIKVPKKIKI